MVPDGGWSGIEAVKADVRNLMTAQEAYRHGHRAYAHDLASLRREFPTLVLLGDRAEIRGTDGGCVITAWNDALRPGSYRCVAHLGTAADEAGVPMNTLVTD